MSTVLVDREAHVVTITLNRPDKLNALNEELLTELGRALRDLGRDAGVRCAILTGAGDKAFAAGADIASMSEMTAVQAKLFADLGHRVGRALEATHFPVIAAVNGFALGPRRAARLRGHPAPVAAGGDRARARAVHDRRHGRRRGGPAHWLGQRGDTTR
jgi:1,4-dihydroxy-2-naphthoyl-CoA synthase